MIQKQQFQEPARTLSVRDKCDVLVVGAGPAGIAAAVTSARSGADTILMERYGHLGGMATGGLVLLFDSLCDGRGTILLKGLIEETIERLRPLDGVREQPFNELGTADPDIVYYWNRHGREGEGTGDLTLRYSPIVDPELLKIVCNEMLVDSGCRMILHSWAAGVVMEDDSLGGVIIESKSGREVLSASVVIDCTGDGDIAAFAGEDFRKHDLALGLVFRVGNVDTMRSEAFIRKNPDVLNDVTQAIKAAGIRKGVFGYPGCKPGNYLLTSRDSVVWFNSMYPGDCLDAVALTEAETESRRAEKIIVDFYKRNVPGFEEAYILDTAPQMGTRGSRQIRCEHLITNEEFLGGSRYEDEIAILQPPYPNFRVADPYKAIPYSALVPMRTDNLLVAGRCLSCDAGSHQALRLIPPCMAMGQAAGTAAAMAAQGDVPTRAINTQELREKLKEQGVMLERS